MSLKIWLIAVLFLAAYVAPSLQEEQEDVEDAPKEVEDLEDPSPSKGCTSYGYCYRWCAKYWKRCYSYPRSKHSCCRCCKYRGDEVEVKSDENQVEDAPKEVEDLEDPSPSKYGCGSYGYCYRWCAKYWKKCYGYTPYKHSCCRCKACNYRGDEVEMKSDESQVEDAPKEVEESDENAEVSDLEDPSPSKSGCRYCYSWCAKHGKRCYGYTPYKHSCCRCCKYRGDEVEMKSDENQVEDAPKEVEDLEDPSPYGCARYGPCYKWCAKYWKLCKRGSKHGCCRCGWCRRYYKGDEVEVKSDEEEVEDSEDPSYKRCGYYNHCYYYYGRKYCRSYYRCHYGR